MSGHGTGTAVLSIVTRQPDGSCVLRRWYVCACCANDIVAGLGEPSMEALVPAEAVGRIMARPADLEGVIVTSWGSS
ncbi:hypothetical protein [Nonomuraea sp. NPDC049750]|uniref:hypothetical protein n=1 Tax=Nonomuraea sp. NPDC049750 TaxID=3154738 RepID=UPI0033E648F4